MKSPIYGVLAGLALLWHGANAAAAVVFEESFDSIPDWQARPAGIVDAAPGTVSCSSVSCPPGSVPKGWDWSYITGRWWGPNLGYPSSLVNSSVHYGPAGKSYITYSESPLSTSGGWGSDSIIMKNLPGEYNELFVRVKVRFDKDWKWGTTASPAKKFLRFGHYVGHGDPWDANENNDNPLLKGHMKPQVLEDLAKWAGGASDIAFELAIRCNGYFACPEVPGTKQYFNPTCYNGINASNSTCYFPPSGSYGGAGTDFTDAAWNPGGRLFADSPGMIGDGGWHIWEVYYKSNSAPGANDGKLRGWIDGVLVSSFETVPFNDSNSASLQGINIVSLGGNAYNQYSYTGYEEHWVAYDDLVVYTPLTSADALWNTSPKDGRLPHSYSPSMISSDAPAPKSPKNLRLN